MSYVHLQLHTIINYNQLQLTTGPPAFPNGGRGHTNSLTVTQIVSFRVELVKETLTLAVSLESSVLPFQFC